MMFPKVSIIVLNYNNLKDTIECVESLMSITYPNYEIIVVDNGSPGNDANALREKYKGSVLLIETGYNYGYVTGNNIGIREALRRGAHHVMILNNDTVVDARFLDELVKVAECDLKVGIVGPRIYYYYNPNRIWFTGARVNWRTGEFVEIKRLEANRVAYVDILSGCAVLLTKELLKKGWLLNPIYGSAYADPELCLRARKEGLAVVYVPSSKVWHKIGAYRIKMLQTKPAEYARHFKPHLNIIMRLKLMKRYSTKSQFLSQFFFHFAWILPKQIYGIYSGRDPATIKMFTEAMYAYLKGILLQKISSVWRRIIQRSERTRAYVQSKYFAQQYTESHKWLDYKPISQEPHDTFIIKLLEISAGEMVLDNGAGNGRFSLFLANKGAEVVSMDINRTMIGRVNESRHREGLKGGISPIRGDIQNLPFRDDVFKKILCVHNLWYIPDYEKAIMEMFRVAKTNGKILVDQQNLLNPLILASKIKRTAMKDKNPINNPFTLTPKRFLKPFQNYQILCVFSTCTSILQISLSMIPLISRLSPFCVVSRLYHNTKMEHGLKPFALRFLIQAQKTRVERKVGKVENEGRNEECYKKYHR